MSETTTETTTLVTPEMERLKGVWQAEITAPPIAESDIRRWAIAVYWGQTPPPVYWDHEYAATTCWGGIIAPEDFNPFAWPVPTGEVRVVGAQPGQVVAKGGNILNGGQREIYGARMRPGDVITQRTRLSHWEERVGRNGLTLYSYLETRWTNQRGELVKTRISTRVQY